MGLFDSKVVSSCFINFLFGAGVNGNAFPQVNQFCETEKFLKDKLGKESNGKTLETMIDSLSNENDKEQALTLFKEEFNKKNELIDYNCDSISNIKNLLKITYRLVYEAENRKEAMNQINIFTLNYDFIVEKSLESLGFLSNYISASNVDRYDKFFNVVGRDFLLRREIPTFLVSKIHGDISKPVLPGVQKYDAMLLPNYFEIVFKMKEKLCRDNSILFVIGYSGRDEHINRILKDCVDSGLTLYWFKFKKEDYIPTELIEKITVVENDKNKGDTTALFYKEMSSLWEKSLEK